MVSILISTSAFCSTEKPAFNFIHSPASKIKVELSCIVTEPDEVMFYLAKTLEYKLPLFE